MDNNEQLVAVLRDQILCKVDEIDHLKHQLQLAELTDQERELLSAFRKLQRQDRDLIVGYTEYLAHLPVPIERGQLQ